jgi:hypothetical protein
MPTTLTNNPSPRLIRKFELLPANPILQSEIEFHAKSVDRLPLGESSTKLSNYHFTRKHIEVGDSILDAVADRVAQKASALARPTVSPYGFFTSNEDSQIKTGYSSMFGKARFIMQESQQEGLTRIYSRQKGTRQKVLCAPTSRIEDHPISDKGFKMLIDGLVKAEGGLGRQKLIDAIQNGPADGGLFFKSPNDVYEAIGGIVRWLVVSEQKKSRVRFNQEIREKIWEILDSEGYTRKEPMVGGVAAFCSQLLAAQGHDVTMYNEGHMIKEFDKHFDRDLKVFSDDPDIKNMGQLFDGNSKSSPGHFTVSLKYSDILNSLSILKIKDKESGKILTVDVRNFPCTNRDIIISGAQFPVGFSDNIPEARITNLGNEMDLGLFSGFQYPTDIQGYDKYFRGLNAFAKGTAAVALEYSEPKCAGEDVELYGLVQLRNSKVTAIACNTSEAIDLLLRIKNFHDSSLSDQAALYLDQLGLDESFWKELNDVLARFLKTKESKDQQPADAPWTNPTEDSIWLYGAAKIIQRLTNIPFVRVRGQYADVTLTKPGVTVSSPEDVVKKLTFSRKQAALKSATKTGNIRDVTDEVPLECVPQEGSLASNIRLGEWLSFNEPSEIGITERLARDWHIKLPSGHQIFLAVPHDFINRKNTVSAGDAMAATAWSSLADDLKATHAAGSSKKTASESAHPSIHIG